MTRAQETSTPARSLTVTETMTTAEAALILSLSISTVRSLIERGRLEADRDGQRWAISAASVHAEAARRRSPVEPVAADDRSMADASAHVARTHRPRSISPSTLRVLVVVVAVLVVGCSALLARNARVQRQQQSARSALVTPAFSPATHAVGDETDPATPDVVLLLAGAGMLLGSQLVLFAPLVITPDPSDERPARSVDRPEATPAAN